MCLIDSVVHWDTATILCRTQSHRDPRNPLRSPEGLSALQGVEYGAQAMAIHGALLALEDKRANGRGYLVAVENLFLDVDWLHDVPGPLDVQANLEVADCTCVIHQIQLQADASVLVRGRLIILRQCG